MERLLKGLISPRASYYHKILVQSLIRKFSLLRSGAYLYVVPLLAVSMFLPNSVSALGVGVVESNSFIGERLEVRIPLFNVEDPNSLQIDFSSPQFDSSNQSQVNVSLDRSNSQLAVRLNSAQIMNEPYLNFTLGLIDADTEFSKEFTVLLNLSPTSAADGGEVSTGVARPLPQQNSYQVSGIEQVSGTNQAPSGSIMGPYDTAQAGQIPEKFGAVLDGQSLWRVARRINSAMGASRSQMMWALFQANPDAFSGSTIESLKAGSYLTIPSAETVKQVSDQQAKNNIANLGNGSSSTAQTIADSTPAATAADEFELGDVDSPVSTSTEVIAESPFQVTGIDQGAGQSDENSSGSEKIISSLTETVGNLSQQLERKDRRIDFLEQQVAELKQYIGNEPIVNESSGDSSLVEQGSDVGTDQGQTETSANGAADSNTQGSASNVESNSLVGQASSIPVWQWALLALFVVSLALYFARERIVTLARSLNLFGANDQVSFEREYEHQVDVAEFSFDQTSPESAEAVTESQAELVKEPGRDFSIMESVKHNMDSKEVLEGISYLDFADDGSYEENDVLELVTEEQYDQAPAEDLTFDERFEFLLKEKDFEFARELLDFARYNEIDDDRYHCERLRLLEKKKDEDGFYEYYYEIEAKIPTFPPALQTKISQLVVQLAHT